MNVRISEFNSLIVATLSLISLTGCPTIPVPGGGAVIDGNRDTSLTSPLGKTFGEPNGSFSTAVIAVFDQDDVAELQGTVSARGDLDVFLLGSLNRGDRVRVDTATVGSSLDISIALFDDQQRLVLANDDRCGDPTQARCFDSVADLVIRHDGERYFLVVTGSAFAARGAEFGTYTVDVQLLRGGTAPAPVPQTLVLEFGGGAVDSPTLGTFVLDPFDAARIDPAYTGRTQTMRDAIVTAMRQNYERFNVTLLTGNDLLPEGTRFSVIYFGGFNPTAFGLAESVDLYNVDRCDDAIIFTESFSISQFSRTPTAEQMGLALGNIAAHEAGHLLGLNHVDDDLDLMDDRSPADVFLLDQEFKTSALSSDIMSIGVQDGVLLLNETVGPAAGP
jgi:hypothetical protein